MRSDIIDVLPLKVRRSLRKLGSDISIARKKRRLTIAMMAERMAVAPSTYARVEKGNAKVALGIYAMALFVLGFGDIFGEIIDVSRDDHGLLLDIEALPKRIRVKKS
jgi:transcriptional regulator with XRE-family HTH domain